MISEQDIPWVMFGTIICGSVYSSCCINYDKNDSR